MRLSWPARCYIAAVTVTASGVMTFCFRVSGRSVDVKPAAMLAAVFLLAEMFPVALPRGGAYSVSFVVALAAIVTHGPAVAVIAAAAGGLNLRNIRRHSAPIASRLFNGGNFIICTGLAALIYNAMHGPTGPQLLDPGSLPKALIPVLAATGVNFAANTSIVAVMLSLATPRKGFRAGPITIWRTEFASLLPGYFAFALLGLLLGVLYLQVHSGALVFVIVPLLVARSAFAVAVRMQVAYEATVEALITAIEAKDSYTHDHAGRVAKLTEMAGREFGVRGRALRTIRMAALMHDVGKLGVPTTVLVKPGKLTAEEDGAMRDHPKTGQHIVEEIDLLRDAVAGIRHHHERMDGGGYPDGLKGDQIPQAARLITVCDAFDAMTSTRTYRPAMSSEDALVELKRCSGTQFDPRAIQALERALAKHGWTAEPEIHRVRRQGLGRATRHDDPHHPEGRRDAAAL